MAGRAGGDDHSAGFQKLRKLPSLRGREAHDAAQNKTASFAKCGNVGDYFTREIRAYQIQTARVVVVAIVADDLAVKIARGTGEKNGGVCVRLAAKQFGIFFL